MPKLHFIMLILIKLKRLLESQPLNCPRYFNVRETESLIQDKNELFIAAYFASFWEKKISENKVILKKIN